MRTKREKEIDRIFELRRQLSQARLNRRELLKLGILGAGAAYLGVQGNWLGAESGSGSGSSGSGQISPPTTPFRDPLPIPPVLGDIPQSQLQAMGGPVTPGAHQFYSQYPAQKFYESYVRENTHTFHSQLPPSVIWGHDGIFPGPTIHARYGEPILLRIHNDLPPATPTFGIPQVITHLHNMHSAPESDGGPWDFYDSGQFKDHHYCMARAGFTTPQFLGMGDPRETLGTLFFHAHRPDFTAPNVYKGMVGFFLAFDELDTGDEHSGLRLPSGEFDVPLHVSDKVFDRDGQLFFDNFNLDGILGDKMTVNGAIQPFFEVKRRKYRFRILVGGPARFMQFHLRKESTKQFLSNPFTVIANDGNLLERPVRRSNLHLEVAERYDVIIDFKELTGSEGAKGQEFVLYNRLEQTDGRKPTGKLLNPGTPVLKFKVVSEANDSSQVPSFLRELPPIDLSEVKTTRTWRFERGNGAWQVNAKFFDPLPKGSQARVKRNTAEIWVLQNNSGGWEHPIHIHLEEFRILSRNGAAPPAHEAGRKDVVRLGRNEEIRIFMRFRDFPDPQYAPPPNVLSPFNFGRYPIHCHNMTHEDHAMMARWDVEA